MKTLYIHFCLFFCLAFNAQIIHFNCPNFKNYLLQSQPNVPTVGIGWAYSNNWSTSSGYYATSQIKLDANNNGEIEVSEAQNVTVLNIGGQHITDLTGLQYFTNLKFINFALNAAITSFHFPMLNQLEHIHYGGNNITNIDLSIYPNLKDLYCMVNGITQLDLSQNPQLRLLACWDNQLTSLDLSNNPEFIFLNCKNNQIQNIKLNNGAMQSFTDNSYMHPNAWANNPLSYICCDVNEAQVIQNHLVANGYNMANITLDTTNTCALSTGAIKSYNIAVYPNPSTGLFNLTLPEVFNAKVEVFNTLGQKVYDTSFENQQNMVLDLGYLNKGVYFLKVQNEDGDKFEEKIIIN